MMVPMPVVPVMMMPVAVVPMMVVPAHLHGLHLIDFALRDDRRLNVYHSGHSQRVARDQRYGRGLCARSQQDRARDQSSTEIQEIPKFHDLMPFHEVREKTPSLAASR
jgi:predicted RNA polymerase sigma factor